MAKKLSGRVEVPARTPIPLGTGGVYGKLAIKYDMVSLAKTIFVGNDGSNSVSPETGFPLNWGEGLVWDNVELLSDIYLFLDANPLDFRVG